MAAQLASRYVIGAAFAAGVATTVAFVSIGSRSDSETKNTPTAGSPSAARVATQAHSAPPPEAAPANRNSAQFGSGSWVDPVQNVPAKQASRSSQPPLEFHLKDTPEERGSSAKLESMVVAAPLPPRRPEVAQVARIEVKKDRTPLADRGVRKVLIPDQADATRRTAHSVRARVRYAESFEAAPGREPNGSRQRVTSGRTDGVMGWLVQP